MAVALGRATALAALWCLLAPHVLEAQVLTTGETLGKGKSGILLSGNVVVPGAGIPNLTNAYAEFVKGLSERFDLYLAAGATTTDGATQGWLGGGGNLRLIRIRKVTLSFFSIASVALTRRDEACQVLWNPALVASVPLSKTFSVYTGLNGLVPIGDRERGIFTPPSATTNVPIGGTYAIGPWGLWGEADVGNLKAVGFGLTRVF